MEADTNEPLLGLQGTNRFFPLYFKFISFFYPLFGWEKGIVNPANNKICNSPYLALIMHEVLR